MNIDSSAEMLTLFSAEIDTDEGPPSVTVPEQELTVGELDADTSYRVAIYPMAGHSPSNSHDSSSNSQRSQETSPPPVEQGDTREVEVEDVGDQGDGIARLGPGYIVFVPDAGIGDRVKINITEARENFAFAEVVEHEPVTD